MVGWVIGFTILAVLYLSLLALVGYVSAHPPRVPEFVSPGLLGLPEEDVVIESPDGVALRAWWVCPSHPRGIAVLSHGYIVNRSELVAMCLDLVPLGYACLLLDSRAHGQSGGKVTTLGWNERHDVAAGVAWARSRVGPVPVLLIGSSMGAVASALACADDPSLADALVLDAAYSRLSDSSKRWWRFLGMGAASPLFIPSVMFACLWTRVRPGQVDVARALEVISGKPMLLLNGDKDTVVPRSEVERNLRAAGPNARLEWFEGCEHSQGRYREPERYRKLIEEFASRLLR